jgi:hypothetical protein
MFFPPMHVVVNIDIGERIVRRDDIEYMAEEAEDAPEKAFIRISGYGYHIEKAEYERLKKVLTVR